MPAKFGYHAHEITEIPIELNVKYESKASRAILSVWQGGDLEHILVREQTEVAKGKFQPILRFLEFHQFQDRPYDTR